MDLLRACLIADGDVNAESREEFHEAYQVMIDTGFIDNAPGRYGRVAIDLIEAGHCRFRGAAQ